jgi:hypothetical protein
LRFGREVGKGGAILLAQRVLLVKRVLLLDRSHGGFDKPRGDLDVWIAMIWITQGVGHEFIGQGFEHRAKISEPELKRFAARQCLFDLGVFLVRKTAKDEPQEGFVGWYLLVTTHGVLAVRWV